MIDMFDTNKTLSELDFAEAKRLEDDEAIKDAINKIYILFRDSFSTMSVETHTCKVDFLELTKLVKTLFSSYLVTDIVNMYYRNQMRTMSERAWNGSPAIASEVHETLLFLGALRKVSDMALQPYEKQKGAHIRRTVRLNAPDTYSTVSVVTPYMDAVRLFKVLAFLARQISLLTNYEALSKVSVEKKEREEAGEDAFFEEMDRI